MNDLVTLGVALLVAVVGPVLLSMLSNRQRRAEKLEDYKRQDMVAARLLAENAKVSETASTTLNTLRVVHTLVNSNMTSEMEGRLEETEHSLVLMLEVLNLNRAAGREPLQSTLDCIAEKEAKIEKLRTALQDRAATNAIVDRQTQEAALRVGVAASSPSH